MAEWSGGWGGKWSLVVVDSQGMAMEIEERRCTTQETDDTSEKVAARWAKMDPNQRRAVIAAMVDRIVVGTEKITMLWANAATMATRYANGALVNLRGEVVEPRRHGRPRKMEAVDTGEGLDLEGDDTDDEI